MEFVALGKYIAALAFVAGLIGLLGLLLRKYGQPGMRIRPRGQARLEVRESLPIDARSRLFIIRRDNVEHLLVKTGEQVAVVETGIPCLPPQPETDEEPKQDAG